MSRPAVTYADLAEHYYGKRYLERHLRVLNRRPEPLARGSTIIIPTYRTVTVRRGQSLESFASRYLQNRRRAGYLAALHGLDGRRLRPGLRLKVVPSLPHVVRPGESLASIARTYYRDARPRRLDLLRRYNELDGDRLRAGARLRIPLDTAEFAKERVARRAKARRFDPAAPAEVAVRPKKRSPRRPARPRRAAPPAPETEVKAPAEAEADAAAEAEARIETAARLYDEGDYERARAFAHRSLESAPGPPPPHAAVELLRIEAFALVALDRYEDAAERFRALLGLDPGYELDLYRTSPKILDIFEAVAER